MPYLIDGNNLIGTARELDLKDTQAREKLTRLLGQFQRAKNNTITVVYDGPPPPGVRKTLYMGGLRVIYAGPEKDADSVIRDTVSASADPRSWLVVTSDRQVYSWVRWAGAQAMQSRAFYAELQRVISALPVKSPAPNEKTNVDEWLDYFGIDEKEEEDG